MLKGLAKIKSFLTSIMAGSGSANQITISGSVTSQPVTVTASGSDAAVGVAIIPKSTGALMAAIPDSTSVGGNPRGANAVDWQQTRGSAMQVAGGISATIGGGANNAATSIQATVAGGGSNSASGANAAVGGGSQNVADANSAWVPGGSWASARQQYGKGAWAGGRFSTGGDAQVGEQVLRRQTTDATVTRLTADNAAQGTANTANLPNNGAYAVTVMVVGKQTGGSAGTANDTAVWFIQLAVKRGANVAATAIVGNILFQTSTGAYASTAAGTGAAPALNDAATAAWRVAVAADTTYGGIAVSVTGEVNKNINWVARVQSVETLG